MTTLALPISSTLLMPPGHPDDYVVLEDRPVWKEHIAPDGTHFGRAELQRVIDRCNERIADTGDFSGVVIRHTTDDGSRDPKLIGFAGPFKLGRVGNLKPKWAILAKLWIYREDQHELRRYPRLSVEYWSSKKDPTGGYFDPISLLGAETPELDLGVRYSRNDAGVQLLRYSKVTRFQAAAPGGSNTFVPGMVDEDKRKTTYNKGGLMLAEEDLKQIVEAMTPVIKASVDEAVASLKSPEEAPPEEVPAIDGEEVPAEMLDEPGDEVEGDDELPDGNDDPTDLEGDDEPPADAPPEPAGEEVPPIDEEGDDDKPTPKKYQKVRAERDEYRTKYQKEVAARRDAEAERDQYKAKVDAAEGEARKATRYQKLTELNAQGYVFEIDAEAADCSGMTEEQFDKHCDRIVSRYQRVPIGRTLPQDPPKKYDGESPEQRRQRYSKQAAETAASRVEQLRKAKKKADYKTEYDAAMAELEAADGTAS